MTGNDICTTILTDAGILGVGETADSAMISETQKAVNRMLSSWSAQMTPIWSKITNEFPLIPDKREYTIGPTGDFVQPRPLQITSCQLRIWNNYDFTVKVVSWDDYQYTLFKPLRGFPRNVGWNPTIPNGTLDFYPIPITTTAIRITSLVAMDSMTLGAEYAFPPGYEQAVIANGAVLMMAKYKIPVDADTRMIALNSKQIVDSANFNSQIGEMSPDFSAPGYQGPTGAWQYLWGWGAFGGTQMNSNKVVFPDWAPGNGSNPDGSYKLGEVARQDNSTYMSLLDGNVAMPVGNPSLWQVFEVDP